MYLMNSLSEQKDKKKNTKMQGSQITVVKGLLNSLTGLTGRLAIIWC